MSKRLKKTKSLNSKQSGFKKYKTTVFCQHYWKGQTAFSQAISL